MSHATDRDHPGGAGDPRRGLGGNSRSPAVCAWSPERGRSAVLALGHPGAPRHHRVAVPDVARPRRGPRAGLAARLRGSLAPGGDLRDRSARAHPSLGRGPTAAENLGAIGLNRALPFRRHSRQKGARRTVERVYLALSRRALTQTLAEGWPSPVEGVRLEIG